MVLLLIGVVKIRGGHNSGRSTRVLEILERRDGMLLWAVNEPLEIIRLEAFTGQGDIERTHERGAGRSVLGVHGCLEHPARL
jgi:hypothetical protein